MTSHKSRARDSATAFYQSMFDKPPEKDLPIVDSSDGRLNVSTLMSYELYTRSLYTNLHCRPQHAYKNKIRDWNFFDFRGFGF